MARTRSQKEKAQGKPSRERRLENATHAEEVAAHEAQLQDPAPAADEGRMKEEEFTAAMKKKMKKCQEDNKIEDGPWEGEKNAEGKYPCPFEGCRKVFARRADYLRHRNSCHCKLRLYRCKLGKCTKAYAQKGSLDNHVKRCKHRPFHREGDGIRPCTYPPCPKTFSDPSSLTRHIREQHKRHTYQCPFEGCNNHLGKRKRVKRCSEFKKHMMKIHKTSEDVFTKDFFKTCRVKKDELDETTVIAGPSMHAGSDALLSNDGDFAAAAPPYSLTPRLGEIPLLSVPHSDGYASTPGLSPPGLSPSPGVSEVTYEDLDARWVDAPQPSPGSIEECLNPSFFFLPENASVHSFSMGTPGYGPHYGVSQDGYLCPTAVPHGNMFQQIDPPQYDQAMHAPYPSSPHEGYDMPSFTPAWTSSQAIEGYGVCSPESQPTYPLQSMWSDPYLHTQPQMVQPTASNPPALDTSFALDPALASDPLFASDPLLASDPSNPWDVESLEYSKLWCPSQSSALFDDYFSQSL